MNFYYVVSVCQCRDTHHKLTDPISHSEWGCMSPSLSTEILCESPQHVNMPPLYRNMTAETTESWGLGIGARLAPL